MERMMVARKFELENDQLFGGSIEDAYAYLVATRANVAQGAEVVFDQVWTGYEDCHFELQWQSLETDDELESRKRQLEWDRKREEEKREAAKAVIEVKRQQLRQQQAELDAEMRKLDK